MTGTTLKLALALAALTLTASAALAGSHPVGPFTKSQLARLCRLESGELTTSPSSWMCAARLWTIDCVENGRLCVIDLLATAPGESGPRSVVADTGGTGGTGGGYNGFGPERVDTSGFTMGQPEFGDGNTIVTNGDHHGPHGPLH